MAMIKCLKYLTILFVVLSVVLSISGCDGFLAISGTVFEWVDAPSNAKSTIYVNKSIPENIKFIPLQGAQVTVGPKQLVNDAYLWGLYSINTTSESEGNFQGGKTANPAKDTYLVIINKEGYDQAIDEFISPIDDTFRHEIKAVLVKNNSQN